MPVPVISSLFIFVFLLLAQFTGSLVFEAAGINNDKKWTSAFFRSLAGICLVLFFYVLFKSGGRSTMMLLLVPGLLLALRVKTWTAKINWKAVIPSGRFILAALLCSVLAAVLLSYFFESTTLQEDSGNYLKMAESMRLSGQENTRHFRNLFSAAYHGIEPYHYFELWLAAFFMDLPGHLLSHLECLRVAAYGVILVYCIFGLLAVFENAGNGRTDIFHYAAAVLFLFFVPNIVQFFFDYDKHFNYGIISNPITRLNFRTYWMFLLPGIILLLRREYYPALISLFLLPVISITTGPAVLGAYFLFLFFNRWVKLFDRKTAFRLFLLLGLFVVTLVLFLSVFKMRGVDSLYKYNMAYILSYYKLSWKAILYITALEVVNILIVFGPYYLLVLLLQGSWKNARAFIREQRVLLLFVFFMNLGGILFFQATSFMNNAYQFAFTGFCLLALLIPVLLEKSIPATEKPVKRYLVYGALLCFLVFSAFRLTGLQRQSLFSGQEVYSTGGYHSYDAGYTGKIKAALQSEKRPGAFIGDSAYYKNLYYSKRLPDFYFPGSSYFIFAQSDDSYQFCFSDTAAIFYNYRGNERDRLFMNSAVASSLFHKTYYAQAGGSPGTKRKEAIAKYKIAYVILTPGVAPDAEWADQIRERFSDPVTGETFVLLK